MARSLHYRSSPMKNHSDSDSAPGADVTPLTLLVIDDENRVRHLIRRMLEPHICQVVEAGDGAEGLTIVETHTAPIHAVLTDLRMPGIDGAEVIEALALCCPRLPVVAMTAQADASLIPPSVRIIAKPFEPRDVIATVIDALVQGRAARANGKTQADARAEGRTGARNGVGAARETRPRTTTIQRENLNLIAAVLALRERRPARRI